MITVVEEVAKIITNYTGYRRGQAKEDDLAIRKRMITELKKSKNNLKNSLEHMYENDDRKGSKKIRKVIDEIEMFNNEVDLSESGHSYALFDPKKSIRRKDIKKVAELDKSILETCINVTEATKKIQERLINGKRIDSDKEFGNLRQYITNIRNDYKNRLDYIKSVEPEKE